MTAVIPGPNGARYAANMPHVPLHPKNPERTCWGCDKYCPGDDLACGNGTIRAPHPIELFGDDWVEWLEGTNPRTQAPTDPGACQTARSSSGDPQSARAEPGS